MEITIRQLESNIETMKEAREWIEEQVKKDPEIEGAQVRYSLCGGPESTLQHLLDYLKAVPLELSAGIASEAAGD